MDMMIDSGLHILTNFQAPMKPLAAAPPKKLVKDISFLQTIKPLDIEFFRTTSYRKVCKTFEAEDSWEQDVVIFMIDKDEIRDGKVVLREVQFSRPVKI